MNNCLRSGNFRQPAGSRGRRFCRRTCLLALVACLLAGSMPASQARAEQAFTLAAPERLRPYAAAEFTLGLPWAGELSLTAAIGQQVFPLILGQAVSPGELALPSLGLSANGEPLPQGPATLTAVLRAGDSALEASAVSQVTKPAPGLLYAVLSRISLPATGGEDLYADHQLSQPGRLIIRLYRADNRETALREWNLERKDSLPHAFRWDKTIKGQPAPAGDYVLTFEAARSAQGPLERAFTLTAEPAQPLPLSVQPAGSFLPEGGDEAAVWQAMMAPVTVVDIGDMQHQAILSQPDPKSAALGLVHGQTAGLEVLDLGQNGYARVRTARHGDGEWITGYVPQDRLKVIQPDSRYGLLIDKKEQTLTVYREGRALSTLSVSTGIYVPPGTDSFDTLAGAFLTQDRIAEFASEGFRYAYATRIDGGNLIHSTGYQRGKGGMDYARQLIQLGQPASHGCVRVDHRMNSEGINAWWLYANLPRNTKVLVLPGSGAAGAVATQAVESRPQALPDEAPPTQPPSLLSQPGFQVADDDALTAAEDTISVSVLPEALAGRTRLTLSFGGDCVLGSEEKSRDLPDSFHSIVAQQGEAWPFSGLEDYFQNDDLSMVNLENVLKDNARGLDPRLHNFRGPASFANILKLGGIDLVNLANNHFPDYGQDGKNSTRAALKAAGIPYAGYSSLHIADLGGIRIGFGGIRETVFHQDRQRITREIAELARQGADYIVYTCHFGTEYELNHNDLQTLMARSAIDAGADLIIGHHPHVVQGIEQYQDGLIFYSLGNLVFGGNLALSTFDGLVAQVILDFEGTTLKQTAVRLIPVITSGIRPANDFRPAPATGEDKQRILASIHADSAQAWHELFILPQQ